MKHYIIIMLIMLLCMLLPGCTERRSTTATIEDCIREDGSMLLSTAVSSVRAEEIAPQEDSSNISDEILALLPLEKDDQIVRVYVTYIPVAFYYCRSIDELWLSNIPVTNHYVVTSKDGTITDYVIQDGNIQNLSPNDWVHEIMEVYLSGEVIKLVSPDITVESAYYLAGSAYTGNAIYYKTSLGDYVYYRSYRFGLNGEYLFSLESFRELQATLHSYLLEHGDRVGVNSGWIDADLSAYEIGSENFDPNAPFTTLAKAESSEPSNAWLIGSIALGVCLVSAAAILLILRQRRKKAAA